MTNGTTRHTSKTPQVSVLMPVYNVEAYVAEAIESILGQTLADFEFLIVDDGSTDGSAEIVAFYAEKDPRISFRMQENRGVPITRNEMAAAARAPFLAVMDADDVALPHRLETQIAFLEKKPDISAVGSDALVIDEASRPIMTITHPTDPQNIDESNIAGFASLVHPSVTIRADRFHEVGGYDEYFRNALDLDLWLRLAENGKLANLPEVLIHYRAHTQSISGRNKQTQIELAKEACRRAWGRRGLQPQSLDIQSGHIEETGARTLLSNQNLKRAWQAWTHGYQSTARHYFLRAVQINPFSSAAWKGLIFGTIKRPQIRAPRRRGQ